MGLPDTKKPALGGLGIDKVSQVSHLELSEEKLQNCKIANLQLPDFFSLIK